MNVSNLNTVLSTLGQRFASVAKVDGDVGAHETASRGNILPALEHDNSSVKDLKNEGSIPKPNAEELRDLVEKANDSSQVRSSNLNFSVAEGTDINVVRVEDSETGELIRQIPSEQMVALARALDEQKQGMVLEERA